MTNQIYNNAALYRKKYFYRKAVLGGIAGNIFGE